MSNRQVFGDPLSAACAFYQLDSRFRPRASREFGIALQFGSDGLELFPECYQSNDLPPIAYGRKSQKHRDDY